MLRKALLVIEVVLAMLGVWLMLWHALVPGLQILLLAAVLIAGTVFENWRYRKGPAPRGAQWQRTDEKFSDPISGEEMAVEYDPISGERRYVRR